MQFKGGGGATKPPHFLVHLVFPTLFFPFSCQQNLSSSSTSMSLKEYNCMASSHPKMPHKTHNQDLNLKATELRLGLPGSESPERVKTFASGAKRGFSDAINVPSATWGFPENGGSEVDFVKTPRGENKNPNSVKETVADSESQPSDSKSQHSVAASKGENKNPNSVKETVADSKSQPSDSSIQHSVAASKAQVVGWPPIRSFRKNSMAAKHTKNEDDPNVEMGCHCVYVKVSMDGAPYLRKVDLKIYSSYLDLSSALTRMFSSFTSGQNGNHGAPTKEGSSESPLMDLLNGSEYVLTYEDKDGDLMLVGDVPWEMFTGSCKRMRIMKSSDAIGLAPRAVVKCEGDN